MTDDELRAYGERRKKNFAEAVDDAIAAAIKCAADPEPDGETAIHKSEAADEDVRFTIIYYFRERGIFY